MFNLFLTPVYDTESARQFRASMNKEFGIDQEYSGRQTACWPIWRPL